MRALHDRSDDDTRTAVLPRDLRHRRVTYGEVRRSAQHSRKRLGIAAGGAHLHVEAVLFENADVHADIEIDVAEVVHRFAETHRLQCCRACGTQTGQRRGADATRNCRRRRQEAAAAE